MLRCFFCSRRRWIAPYGIFVFFLAVFVRSVSFRSWANLSIAAWRFAGWVRCSWDMMRRAPSLQILFRRRFWIRSFCSVERSGQLATSNKSVTRVLSLFTFCPPGPLLRENLKTSDSSEILVFLLISITVPFPLCSFVQKLLQGCPYLTNIVILLTQISQIIHTSIPLYGYFSMRGLKNSTNLKLSACIGGSYYVDYWLGCLRS